MKCLIPILFACSPLFSLGESLPSPVTTAGNLCGAGNVVLLAESSIDDPELIFDWYRVEEGTQNLLGSIEGELGRSQFITPFIISTETFFVRVRVGELSSPIVSVQAVVDNNAFILEAPRVEVCDEVVLHSSNTFDDAEDLFYQWQMLVAREDEVADFEDLSGSNSTLADLSISVPGFYRVVVNGVDGCTAISGEVEVTNDRFIHATPVGGGRKCFVIDNPFTHEVSIESEYQREIAEYVWEESSDGLNFDFLSNEPQIVIVKPASIETNTSTYYQLTVSEQNCMETSEIISIDWTVSPTGTIQHTDASISHNDFFYCGTDPESLRTLEAISSDNVSYQWVRAILLPDVSLNFIKNSLRDLNPFDPTNTSLFGGFDLIGSGPTITLNQEDGGLIYALFTDLETGCVSYSSNAIFADTSFSFPLSSGTLASDGANIVCAGEGTISFASYDQSVDSYSWQFLDSENFVEIGTEPELLLDAAASIVAGTYRLEVIKNGCVDRSQSFFVVESEPVDALIQAFDGTDTRTDQFVICPGEEVFLTPIQVADSYNYRWMTDQGIVLSSELMFTVTEAGSYILEITNGACVDVSQPFVVTEDPIPLAELNLDLSDPDLLICEPRLVELSNVASNNTYQWFFSENNLMFEPLADEVTTDYFANQPGHFYVEVTNSVGCTSISDTLHIPAIVIANLNFDEEAKICSQSDHALLMLESPIASNTHHWLSSPDNIAPYTPAPGINNLSYYQAFDEGYYVVEVSNELCGTRSTPVNVSVDAESGEDFVASIVGENSACFGSSVVLQSEYEGEETSFFWFFSLNEVDYELFNGELASRLTFNTDQFSGDDDQVSIYFRLGLVDNQCSAFSDVFQLEIFDRPLIEIRNNISNETDDVFYCREEELGFCLEAFQVSTNLNLTYEWSRLDLSNDQFEPLQNGQQKSYAPLSAGRYRCVATTVEGECSAVSNEIDVVTLPTVVAGTEVFCFGAPIDLTVSNNFLSADMLESFDIQWFYSSDNEVFEAIEMESGISITIDSEREIYGSGYYYYQASQGDCTVDSEVFFVSEDPNSFTVNISGEQRQLRGVPFELVAQPSDPNVISYVWEPQEFFIDSSIDQPVVVIPEDFEESVAIVSVHAISANGCEVTQMMNILLSDVERAVFSKFITPNGDGLNDVFTITGIEEGVNNKLRIFDNWGNSIYETENYNNEVVKSQELISKVKDGVYFYLFTANGESIKGSFYVKK